MTIENQIVPAPPKKTSLKKALLLLISGLFLVLAPTIIDYYQNPHINGKPQKIDLVEQVTIHTQKGAIKLWAEIARTPKEQQIGLMFRDHLEADKAMLFVHTTPQNQGSRFWMKNTLIPLDIIFISPNQRIVYIVHNAQPLNEAPVGTTAPVQSVLEINGGLAAQWGIAVGDRISSPSL
jgi:uncharacterized protein